MRELEPPQFNPQSEAQVRLIVSVATKSSAAASILLPVKKGPRTVVKQPCASRPHRPTGSKCPSTIVHRTCERHGRPLPHNATAQRFNDGPWQRVATLSVAATPRANSRPLTATRSAADAASDSREQRSRQDRRQPPQQAAANAMYGMEPNHVAHHPQRSQATLLQGPPPRPALLRRLPELDSMPCHPVALPPVVTCSPTGSIAALITFLPTHNASGSRDQYANQGRPQFDHPPPEPCWMFRQTTYPIVINGMEYIDFAIYHQPVHEHQQQPRPGRSYFPQLDTVPSQLVDVHAPMHSPARAPFPLAPRNPRERPRCPNRCQYAGKRCDEPRAAKINGEPHRFCQEHRLKANAAQMRSFKGKKVTRWPQRIVSDS